jgi:hypothetical protein
MHRRFEISLISANSIALGITYEKSIEQLEPDNFEVYQATVLRIGLIFIQFRIVTFRDQQ